MAVQTLQQELEPTEHGFAGSDHPVFREMMADPAVAYVEEVRSLRQRIALLEAELAATKASTATSPAHPVSSSAATFGPAQKAESRVSEFTESMTPAVMSVQPASAPPAPTETTASEPVPNPGFAHAWTAETASSSFEERVAEKAFFQASTVDEESRNWLLEQ